MKKIYQTPCAEPCGLILRTLLAGSFDGNLDDMSGEYIFDDLT